MTMIKKNEKRIEYMDIVRGICIIYMIAGHIDFGVQFDHYIHAFHMPLFFLLSGLFWKKPDNLKKYLIKISKKILAPYFIWALIFLLINQYTFLGIKTESLLMNIKTVLTTNNVGIPIAGALWFLTAFYISNIIFTFMKCKIEKEKIVAWLSGACLVMGMYLQKWTNINLWWSMNASLTGIGLMMIGYYFQKEKIISKLLVPNNFYLGLLIIIHVILVLESGYVNMRTNNYPSIIVFLGNIIISLIVYGSIAKKIEENKIVSKIKNYLMLLGRESMIPLCLNQFVILILNRYIYQNIVSFFSKDFIIIPRVFIALLAVMIITIMTKVLSASKCKALFGK